ncbi:MAG: TolC family protein [Gallionella sp.]|nr:TolC family protein [Gallionella sp.]
MKRTVASPYLLAALITATLYNSAVEASEHADLPPSIQVESALNSHLLVLNAASGLRMEQVNQRNWNSGSYEFNLRAGSSQRSIANTGQRLKEWDVSLERPLRLFNKVGIDQDIGSASVERAEYALGDARHEAGRLLLRLWFGWQREFAQAQLWQKQVELLTQQAKMADKRFKAGDAPRLELNQALAAAAQAGVSQHQAELRAQLAANELARQFPSIHLPEALPAATPQETEHDLAHWQAQVLAHNHELGVVQKQSQVQQLLAQRSRADQLPDPTVGVRYANEMGGNEKSTGIYISVPISFGQRSVTAESAAQQANIAADQEIYVKRRLEGDIYAAHTQAVQSYATWEQAHAAAQAIRSNAELVAKAYALGENSLSDSLTAQRLALESSLAENLSRLDANESRYRLLLDAHQLWPLDEHGSEGLHDHY